MEVDRKRFESHITHKLAMRQGTAIMPDTDISAIKHAWK